ncbi:MAG: asparaginase [Saccharofermentanales bacterium]
MKKILLLSTGGTIACTPSDTGLAPTLSAEDIVGFVPRLLQEYRIEARTIFSLDSSNIQPEEWQMIAREVAGSIEYFDGVVILHGTDTMAYTASMLSFMLRNLDKPVILTGSQLPIAAPGTDAETNIHHAFLAADYGMKGVFVVFDGKIIHGTRVAKVRTVSMNAFESINSTLAGSIVDGQVVGEPQLLESEDCKPFLDDRISPDVCLLKMIPGTKPELFDSIRSLGYRGVVIEGFGLGGVHFLRRNILEKIQTLIEAGIAVLLTTQCPFEVSDLSVYEVGEKALRAGIIPGYDMTSETAVTKLMWVLGHTGDLDRIKKMMLTDYCGEIKVP